MPSELPHEGVLVRLGVSDIHGIGVFAQETIKAGTNVFANDTARIHWVPSSVLLEANLADYQRAFYEDFAIRCGDQLGCPPNFNLLTVGWFVNEPAPGEPPNMVPTANFDLIAARDIFADEELTLDYAAFERVAQCEKRVADATIMAAERSPRMDITIQKPRRLESPEEKAQRSEREAESKKIDAAANDAAIERMIKRSIEQYGP